MSLCELYPFDEKMTYYTLFKQSVEGVYMIHPVHPSVCTSVHISRKLNFSNMD